MIALFLDIFPVKAISFLLSIWFSFYQLVVEKMLASEGIKRVEMSRDEFTRKVWQWKEKYVFTSLFSFLPSTFLFFHRQWTALHIIGKKSRNG